MSRARQVGLGDAKFRQVLWAGLVLLGIVVTIVIRLVLDEPVRQWFLHHPDGWHSLVWVKAFRQLGKAYVVIWLLLLWSCTTNRWRLTAMTLTALLLTGLIVCPVKGLVHRRRPHMLAAVSRPSPPQDDSGSWANNLSFPSGDTAVAFAVATTVPFSLRRRWLLALLVPAGLIGLFRVTTLAHYPSDVLAGAMIGMLAGFGAMRILARRMPENPFAMRGSWRLALALLLGVVVPLAGPFLGMKSLLIFLRVYVVPVAVLMLVGALVSHRIRKHDARPAPGTRTLHHGAGR